MNLIELNRALRQLRLGGIAAVLEMRLHQAQVESMAPIDLISCLVSDELTRRGDRLLERRRKQAQFPCDPQKNPGQLRLHLQSQDESQSDLRSGDRGLHRPSRRLAFCRSTRQRQKPSGTGHRPGRHPTRLSWCSTARPIPCLMNSPKPRSTVRAKQHIESLVTVPLLIIDDLGMAEVIPHRRRGTPGDHHATL